VVEYHDVSDDGWVSTTTDAAGVFFYPPAGQAPLTLADYPELLDGGLRSRLALTLPVGEYGLEVQLGISG
jgi:hypothetical protein